jgi:hypothetical protein
MASTSQEQSQTRRTISSSATVIYKFFLPVVWSGLFGLFTVFEFVQDHPSKWVQLAVWILGTLALAWFCVPLKSVQIAGADLVISNFFKATRVPLSQIDRVTENVILNIHPVRIHFERPTQFGWKITFMPTVRFIPFRSHPIVNELRELAEQEPSGQVALKAPEDSSAGSPSTAGQERSEVDKIRLR